MKDQDEIWVVLKKDAPLRTAIRCENGKQQAKDVRREMQRRDGGEWTTKKTTQKELAAV